MFKILYLFVFINFSHFSGSKTYVKTYFENGKIQSEGWVLNNQKVDYWFFYYENGNKKEEGHFENNKKIKWWIFYNQNKTIDRKCKFENDKMEGICIIYSKGKIIRAEKYSKGEKIKQWESLSEFKKDNTISYLE